MTNPNGAINIGSKVSLTPGAGNYYTAPSDGYLLLVADYMANAYTRADICDSSNNRLIRLQVSNGSSNASGINSTLISIKKGTIIESTSVSPSTSNGEIAFYPLT